MSDCCNCPWKNPKNVQFELMNEKGMIGIEPERGTEKSSGIDVFIPKGFVEAYIAPNSDKLIPLNLRVNIPEGFDMHVNNKSGVATKLKLVKGAELIDEDYKGNLMIHLFNLGEYPILLQEKMKIAQLVIRPVLRCGIEIVDSIDTNTERGEGGFGSTGTIKK